MSERTAQRFQPTPVEGLLVIRGWHGATSYRVAIVGHTPKRFRVRALEPARLPRVGRTLAVGEEALVPRDAVRVTGGVVDLPPTVGEVAAQGTLGANIIAGPAVARRNGT